MSSKGWERPQRGCWEHRDAQRRTDAQSSQEGFPGGEAAAVGQVKGGSSRHRQ